jgi:phosphatidate cytidylyltransferase
MNTLVKRLFSSIVLMGLFFWLLSSCSSFGLLVFTILSSVISLGVVVEFHDIFQSLMLELKFQRLTAYMCAFIVILGTYLGILHKLHFGEIIAPLGLLIFIIFSIQLIALKKKPTLAYGIVFVYLPIFVFIIPLAHIIPLYFIDSNCSFKTTLFLVLVTKSGDVGGYIIGTISAKILKGGNHKMIPSVSPKKSWEGFLGGLLFSIFVAQCCASFLPTFSFYWLICLGFILYLGGVSGDLLESSFKRIMSVKDSGKILPGMGGILDLVDSLIINIPLFYYILYFKGDIT